MKNTKLQFVLLIALASGIYFSTATALGNSTISANIGSSSSIQADNSNISLDGTSLVSRGNEAYMYANSGVASVNQNDKPAHIQRLGTQAAPITIGAVGNLVQLLLILQ